jgi:multidrug resistance efflux pump
MAGVVLHIPVRLGGYTNPALSGLASAAVLCEIADPNQAHVSVEIKEADVRRVEIGQPVAVRPAAQPDLTLKGRVESISPIVERGMVRVTVQVSIEGKRILFGASAAVKFLPKE